MTDKSNHSAQTSANLTTPFPDSISGREGTNTANTPPNRRNSNRLFRWLHWITNSGHVSHLYFSTAISFGIALVALVTR